MADLQWWQQLAAIGGAGLSIVGLIVWLVHQIVKNNRINSTAMIEAQRVASVAAVAAAEQKATEMIAAANKAADARVADADQRADEWRETSNTWQHSAEQWKDIAQRAVETNKITDHFFEVYMPPVGQKVDNGATGG